MHKAVREVILQREPFGHSWSGGIWYWDVGSWPSPPCWPLIQSDSSFERLFNIGTLFSAHHPNSELLMPFYLFYKHIVDFVATSIFVMGRTKMHVKGLVILAKLTWYCIFVKLVIKIIFCSHSNVLLSVH